MVNVTLIVFMIITIVLLFTAMVLSAMASNDAQKGGTDCKEGCHKYSMWSALVTGIAVATIVVVLVIYIYSSRKHIAAAAQQQVAALHQTLGGFAGSMAQPAPYSGVPQAGYPSSGQVMASLSGTA
jgi:NADH:ubiquinone oxidoreductase subunit 5 (subunit L)/multisubunit Na+/H+ antiporter MnhA subunit